LRPRDLRRHRDIVIGHIRLRITRAVLELDVHPLPELPEIERRSVPVDADPLTRGTGLIEGKAVVPNSPVIGIVSLDLHLTRPMGHHRQRVPAIGRDISS
jgi:hypothetical protein